MSMHAPTVAVSRPVLSTFPGLDPAIARRLRNIQRARAVAQLHRQLVALRLVSAREASS